MARGNARTRSNESDPGVAALQVQRRILQLKKERDVRIRAVIAESDTALADLQSQIVALQEEHEQQREKRRAQCVTNIVELVERRKEIETLMLEKVVKMHSTMCELEELMGAGYNGRERDAISSRDALASHRT